MLEMLQLLSYDMYINIIPFLFGKELIILLNISKKYKTFLTNEVIKSSYIKL